MKKLSNSQWYRERNKTICELIKQGRADEVFDRFGLSDTRINEILKLNGMSERVDYSSYTLDIEYY